MCQGPLTWLEDNHLVSTMPLFGEIEVPDTYTSIVEMVSMGTKLTPILWMSCSAWHPLIQVGMRLKSVIYVLEDLEVVGSGNKDHPNDIQRSKYLIR